MNRGHKVKPLKICDIRRVAQHVRDSFKISGIYFPIVELVELMNHSALIEFEIVENEEMPNDYGLTYPKRNKIIIREDVYDKAFAGDGFGRFTMAHELGHLLVHRQETVYARNEHGGNHKTIEDSEWQADKFAQELLIDTRLIRPDLSPYQIVDLCGVTLKAAETAHNSLKREGILR